MTDALAQLRTQSGLATVAGGIQLAYEVFTLKPTVRATDDGATSSTSSPPKQRVVMIMGFAAEADAWYPTIAHFQKSAATTIPQGAEILIMDNRGIGKSSCPTDKEAYSTTIMAADVLALMDHLGWSSANIVGFSMGGMIAMKLAAHSPHRVASLVILGVTGGGWQIVPRSLKGWRIGLRAMCCGSDTPEFKADIALLFHFKSNTLKAKVPGTSRTYRDVLHEEYVAYHKRKGGQPVPGEKGQGHACFTHRITQQDLRAISGGNFSVAFMHGRRDHLADVKFGERLAAALEAPCMLVDGAHFIPRENSPQVCALIVSTMQQRCMPKEVEMCILAHSVHNQELAAAAGDKYKVAEASCEPASAPPAPQAAALAVESARA